MYYLYISNFFIVYINYFKKINKNLLKILNIKKKLKAYN